MTKIISALAIGMLVAFFTGAISLATGLAVALILFYVAGLGVLLTEKGERKQNFALGRVGPDILVFLIGVMIFLSGGSLLFASVAVAPLVVMLV